jgi:hypothetical protein
MSYRSNYDTVILGAGLGSLVTGTILAKAGRKVMILEGQSHPGGSCTISNRGGHSFVRSPVLMLGLEKDGYCEQLFSELGLSIAMLKRPGGILKRPAPYLQIVTDQYRINIEVSRGEQVAEYKREWGDAVGELLHLYRNMDAVDRAVYPFLHKKSISGPPLPLRERIEAIYQNLKRKWITYAHSRINARTYVSRYQFPPDVMKAFEFLNLFWCGTGLGQTSALKFLLYQMLSFREVIRPIGGLIKLCETVAKTFVNSRGELRYRQEIVSIEKESRGIWKMTLKNEEEIHARQLVIQYPRDSFRYSDNEMVTFFFAIDSHVIPHSMGEQLILYRPAEPQKNKGVRLESLLFIVLSLAEEEKPSEARRLLMASMFLPRNPPPTEGKLQQLLDMVIERLHWLMPFSEGKIQYVGNDEQERRDRDRRMTIINPFVKHLRNVRRPHFEYAYQPFKKGLYILPDHTSGMGMLVSEVRSAGEISRQILKSR